jgi:hypothetical protein
MRAATTTLLSALLMGLASAWTSQPLSRSNFIQVASAGTLLSFVPLPSNAVDLPNGVSYTVIKEGKGPAPDRGELAAIRFSAYAGDIKIDDIFDSPEPYYTRIGSGGLLKGVEETLPLMRLGDRWKMTIPVRAPDFRLLVGLVLEGFWDGINNLFIRKEALLLCGSHVYVVSILIA